MPRVIFEDNHIIVVEKPFNQLTQSDKTSDLSLFIEVKDYIKHQYHKPGNVYLGLIHRLDRPVRGIVVFAKTSKAAARLSKQLREKKFTKKYLAICDRVGDTAQITDHPVLLTHYLKKISSSNRVLISNKPKIGYKKSILTYQLITKNNITSHPLPFTLEMIASLFKISHISFQKNTIFDIDLLTGRPHQIRAQLSHIGFPIIGDLKYGASRPLPEKNIALINYFLSFFHPITNKLLEFDIKKASKKFSG